VGSSTAISVRNWVLWLALSGLAVGCGRTTHGCPDCGAAVDAGGGATSGGGGGGSAGASGGAATTAGTGATTLALGECPYGPPPAPLVRYSSEELSWTLDDVLSQAPPLPPDLVSGPDRAAERFIDVPLIQSLLEGVRLRMDGTRDAAALGACQAAGDVDACIALGA
jgi:hypothetical protein